jgi:hypothetical protein
MAGKFTIPFSITPLRFVVPNDRFFLIGSCFTEHIGSKLASAGFGVLSNPFGIIYQPMAISNAINRIIKNEMYTTADLFKNHEGRYVSFDHHGIFSGIEAEKVIAEINMAITEAHMQLKTSNMVIITMGTAWAYRLNSSQQWVANCHKVPQNQFSKHLLEVDSVVASMEETIRLVNSFNPNAKIILTVSPVKHLNDGVIENQQSKAVLILACRKLVDASVTYFPAYEIVTDELRDYRFYATDLAHPSEQAIDYVWERFIETYFTEEAKQKTVEGIKLGKQLGHRPLHDNQEPSSLHNKIEQFLNKYPK